MHLFTDFIQPLINWLQVHTHWALLITFILSFLESLAIIGSIIPGSLSMTAIGLMAGAGVIPIFHTYFAAILGAIMGDSISYLIGHVYKDKLHYIYPFKNYPHWLDYGAKYFEKHGGKSVLIGRFVGPLRSIIPLIAGMLGMKQRTFLTANIISAIGWSFLYVSPGVIIGAASTELSTEAATRFILLIFFIIISILVSTHFLKWFVIRMHLYLRKNLNYFWKWSIKHPNLTKMINLITPKYETDYYSTAIYVLIALVALILFSVLSLMVYFNYGVSKIDYPVYFFLQSIRTRSFDEFAVYFITILNSNIIIYFLAAINIILLRHYHLNIRPLLAINTLCVITLTVSLFIMLAFDISRPQGLTVVKNSPSFPSINLTIITALCLSCYLYVRSRALMLHHSIAKYFFIFLPLLTGLSVVYLGDQWISDVFGSYLLALFLTISIFIIYRKSPIKVIAKTWSIYFILFVLLTTSGTSFYINRKEEFKSHAPYIPQHVISENDWWHGSVNLPIYRINRFGQRIGIFNIQYVGTLRELQASLKIAGWQPIHETFFNALAQRISGFSSLSTPLLTPLYLHKKPSLVMVKENGNNAIIFRLWRSSYYLHDKQKYVWIGSLQIQNKKDSNPKTLNPIQYLNLDNAIYQYKIDLIPLNLQKKLPINIDYTITKIRENHSINTYIG